MSRQLILWRHGLTDWNARGLVQGQTDIPLNDTGRAQAAEAASRLASLQPVRIISSDLSRARDTATALADLTGLTVETDERLREMNFGIREGKTQAEAVEQFPEPMRLWLAGKDVAMPGGESYAQAAQRFAAALMSITDAMAPHDTTVVVAHGAVLRVGTLCFLGIPPKHWSSFGGFNNCSWAVLERRRRGWVMAEWNAGQLPEPVMSDEE